jgi:PTH1 family peptidyl-tRNA hydrolase
MNENLNKLVVGLGNPGSDYARTRHNVGRSAVEVFRDSFVVSDADVEILLPDVYMNLSGGPVAKVLGKDKAERMANADRLIVVHDDIDLPFGEVKVSIGRGSGGQRGVESIIKAIGTKEFVRVRIGIMPVHFGKPRKPRDAAVFVLKKFGIIERSKLPEILEWAGKAIDEIIKNGPQSAMNKFN